VISSSLAAVVPGLADLPGNRGQGWVTGEAHDRVRTAALAGLTPGRISELQRIALAHAAANGIACVHEMAGPAISSESDLVGLIELSKAEPLPEVIGYWGELLGIETARELGAVGAAGDLFCDGSLGSHTAALHEPYADRPASRGSLRYDTADVAEHVVRCVAAGMQAGFHAIGDAAIDQVLDAVAVASARLGRSAGAGSRIEHVEYVSDPHRLAASGLMACVQPAFDATWGGAHGMYAARLGPQRAARLNRLSALAGAGVPLAFGSDAPVTALDPWAGVRAAAYPHEPSSAISVRAAFTAHTRGGWRIGGRDGEGILGVGMNATFTVWQAGELGVDAPDERVMRWSTDPGADVPGLPDVSPGIELPTCRLTVLRGETLFDALT
jgi:predicted amidohydrolase YtcJ